MVAAFVLITLGVLFLLNNLYPDLQFIRTWPVILIVIGLVKVAEYVRNSLTGRGLSAEDQARFEPTRRPNGRPERGSETGQQTRQETRQEKRQEKRKERP